MEAEVLLCRCRECKNRKCTCSLRKEASAGRCAVRVACSIRILTLQVPILTNGNKT
ncbi:hypothetical protein CHUAL_013718 [Chamberlinius hualienensis]